MANLSAIVTVKTVNPKRIECASVNCDREGRLENAIQGRLQLNSEGRSIWVTAYLCDECMRFVKEGKPRGRVLPCICKGGGYICNASCNTEENRRLEDEWHIKRINKCSDVK